MLTWVQKEEQGGNLEKSSLFKHLQGQDNSLNIPGPASVTGYEGNLPYFLVGDNTFKMPTNLMKPYPMSNLSKKQWIYNYRISRAHRLV